MLVNLDLPDVNISSGHTVFLVQPPELEVAVAFVGVVQLVNIGDFGEEGTWVLGERVEEDSIHDDAQDLLKLLVVRVFRVVKAS